MSMSLADLTTDLTAFLGDAASRVIDKTLCLNMGARDLAHFRPRTLLGQITVEAGVSQYAAPADLVLFKAALWGLDERRRYKPWDTNWPGRLPSLRVIESDGEQALYLDPAPSMFQVNLLGSTYKFYYVAAHVIGADADDTTVREADHDLLIVRAAVFALEQVASSGSVKPVQLGDGYSSSPKNGTPAALAELLYKEYERMAA
jgi:hypothetical protein